MLNFIRTTFLQEVQMKPDTDRQALIDASIARYRKVLEQMLPDDSATLDQIEKAIEDIGKNILPDLQEKVANERSKKCRDNKIDCTCGGKARFRGMVTRTLITLHGLLRWTRPAYHCKKCGKGCAPLDAGLGLDKGDTTLGVRDMVAFFVPDTGFVGTTESLRKSRGLDLSASTVERIAVSVGAQLRKAQETDAALHKADQLPDRRTACPRRLYIGADGVMAPMRDEWKKNGSLGKLNCRFGECKTGIVYETYVDKQTGRDSRVSTRSYVATTKDVEAFEPLLGLLAHRAGHHAAKEIVLLGDGAIWIWYMFARLFPGAIQILDFYHACDHIALVAEAMFGKGTDAGKKWQNERQAELKDNGVSLVIAAITAWMPRTDAGQEIKRTQAKYFTDNAERMRYKTYLEKGYHIGSGVIESSCKHIVVQRLDQAGMHWRQAIADAILALRANKRCTSPVDLKPYLAMAA
jgi:hypothetical protein